MARSTSFHFTDATTSICPGGPHQTIQKFDEMKNNSNDHGDSTSMQEVREHQYLSTVCPESLLTSTLNGGIHGSYVIIGLSMLKESGEILFLTGTIEMMELLVAHTV